MNNLLNIIAKSKIYVLNIFWVLMSACTYTSPLSKDSLAYALEVAGENRCELENVLKRYKNNPDKLHATQWLISNMPLHFTSDGEGLERYRLYFSTASDHKRDPKEIVDSLVSVYGKLDLSSLYSIPDITTVDSAFLVNHIEAAFDTRENRPWGKNVRWEDFLEYVLPYRLGDERLSLWREKVIQQYGALIDSVSKLPNSADPVIAAKELYNGWKNLKSFKWTSALPSGPRLGPQIMDWKTGACRERVDGIIYLLRTAGIPCAMHISPLRGDLNDSHTWIATYDSEGNPHILEQRSIPSYEFDVPVAKVHCETYSINHEIVSQFMNREDKPLTLQNPFTKDETCSYLLPERRQSFKLRLNDIANVRNGDTLYIALSSRIKWVPVGYGVYNNGIIDFGYVGENTVCIVGKYINKQFISLTLPFRTNQNTNTRFFVPNKDKKININIYSKHTVLTGDFAERMVGGVFEVSDFSDFSVVDTIFEIKEYPKRLFTVVKVQNPMAKRFLRYKGNEKSYCDIAEISLFENFNDTINLKGDLLGTQVSNNPYGFHEFTTVWDGDPYTCMHYKSKDGGWTGIDLGVPRKVEKIIYSPRNRGNYIHRGYTYELFYYNINGWESVGREQAEDDHITMIAPEGALLYLHCLNGGKDERIFEYDSKYDIQKFW